MEAKALSLSPSMTFPNWQTSIDMRIPPVARRRMYRHSATMHSHKTPGGDRETEHTETHKHNNNRSLIIRRLKTGTYIVMLMLKQDTGKDASETIDVLGLMGSVVQHPFMISETP